MSRKKIKTKPIIEQLEVLDFASEGKCFAKNDGKIIFIELVVPGDIIDVQITKSKKDWAEGYVIRYHQYSNLRKKPVCSHFGICGGCQWQIVDYKQQLKFKEEQAKQQILRIGKVDIKEWLPILPAEDEYFYRNKIEYTFSHKIYRDKQSFIEWKNNRVRENEVIEYAAGFHAKGVYDKIVAIDKCYLQTEPTNEIRNWLLEYCKQNQISLHDIKTHTGFLRGIQLRFCNTGEKMINIIFYENLPEIINPLLEQFSKAFAELTQIFYTINNKWNDSIYDLTPINFKGPGYVIERLGDYEFKIGPKSFFQTHTKQAKLLYDTVAEFADLKGNEIVYDLYCGTGSIGIYLSARAKKIIGVETIAEAIDDAKLNAKLNHVNNTEFFSGDVIKVCTNDFFTKHGKPDVIITDPPRAGMHEKLVEKLLEIEAPKIIYVSCNVATQARDLDLLGSKYDVVKFKTVDLFPQTHHVEAVCLLTLR